MMVGKAVQNVANYFGNAENGAGFVGVLSEGDITVVSGPVSILSYLFGIRAAGDHAIRVVAGCVDVN